MLVKENFKVWIDGAPAGYTSLLGELPTGASLLKKPTPGADLVQVFVQSKKELDEKLPGLVKTLKPGGLLWVTYPKGTSKIKADINRDIIAAYVRTIGMAGVAMISIDGTWSALRVRPL